MGEAKKGLGSSVNSEVGIGVLRMKMTFDNIEKAARLPSVSGDPFEVMSSPSYPAICDQCGREGTNSSMQIHVCGIVSESFDRAERIEQTQRFLECDWETALLIDDCMGE